MLVMEDGTPLMYTIAGEEKAAKNGTGPKTITHRISDLESLFAGWQAMSRAGQERYVRDVTRMVVR